MTTEQYAGMSENLDRSSAWIETALPRSYVIAAFAVLAPSFLSGTASLAQLAISFGAILFTSAAIERLTAWLSPGTAAWIAWRNVKLMFDAAAGADRRNCRRKRPRFQTPSCRRRMSCSLTRADTSRF